MIKIKTIIIRRRTIFVEHLPVANCAIIPKENCTY